MAKKKIKLKRETWSRLFQYLKKYLWLLALSIILAGVTVVLSLYIPILCGRVIDCMIDVGQVDFDAIAQNLTKIAIATLSCGIL